MIQSDIVGNLLTAVAHRSAIAPGLAFLVGIVTSAGPCLGPRLASLIGLAAGAHGVRRALIVGSFIGGLAASYAVIACSATLFLRMTGSSTWIYGGLAALLACYGVRALVFGERDHPCGHAAARSKATRSCGSALLAGASYAFVASPCCTPIVASIAGIAGMNASRWFGLAVALTFALGHATPLLLASLGATQVSKLVSRRSWQVPISVINGSLMLALGGYYALVA